MNRFSIALCLLLAGTAGAQQPVPDRPGFFYIDDMIVPEAALAGPEANWIPNPWPNATVPYLFDSAVSSANQAKVLEAMAEIEACSGLRFVPWSSGASVLIIRPNPSNSCPDNCSSADLGYTGGPQFLNVGSNHWNTKYVLVHELFHTLGFTHEQQRIDRNQYVTINSFAISQTRCDGPCNHNFDVVVGSVPQTPYDFLSIMHYGQYAFSICFPNCSSTPLPTIIAKPGYTQFQNQMGNRSYMTHYDAQGLAAAYGNPVAPTITSISPTSVTAGSNTFTLTINGAQFLEGSPTSDGVQGTKVRVGGQAVTTTWVDSTQVRALVPWSLITSTGTLSVYVENDPQSAGGQSNVHFLTVNAPFCPTQNDRIGYSVAGLGDVDGDGAGDILVGAPGVSSNNGTATCYSGRTGGVLWSISGGTGYEMGKSVANAGDLNGDDVCDAIIGAPSFASFQGLCRVVDGATGNVIRSIYGGGSNREFGWSVANAGDVDGDGVPDHVIGAPAYNSGQGRIEVRSGSTGSLVFAAAGASTGDRFGYSVSGGHDVNGDDVPDYCVGAPNNDDNGTNAGKMWCYSGSGGATLFSRMGDGDYDYFGRSVAIIPSTTASSVAEVAVGAPDWGSLFGQGGGPGYVKVYRRNGVFFVTYLEIANYTGSQNGDRFGQTVAAAGDLDDDGYMDLVIGATEGGIGAQPNSGPGYVEVYSGRTQTLMYSRTLGSTGDDFGWAAAAAGDLNEDGVPDLVVGAPFGDVPCGNAGSYHVFNPIVAPAFEKVMITEITTGEPDGLEITNFSNAARSLTDWRVVWHNGGTRYESPPFPSTVIQPGESVVVREAGAPYAEMPAGTQELVILPSMAVSFGNFTVALVNATDLTVDEVRVESTSGAFSAPHLGGSFRGAVLRHQSGPLFFPSFLERVWGLDSNSGGDWSAEFESSFGLENRLAALRMGHDPIPVHPVKITEIDDNPDYIEIHNLGPGKSLQGWYFLCSSGQGLDHTVIRPWPQASSQPVIQTGGYKVVGDGSAAPPELPASAGYHDLFSVGGGNIPFTTSEYSCALYDRYGRLVDCMRTSGHDDEVTHNHPRPPRTWKDFTGTGAVRSAAGVIGRNATSTDNDVGDDWRAVTTRTMGSANPGTWVPDSAPQLDVRLNATGQGGGMTLILNGGPSRAGQKWTFAVSAGHLSGQGPLLGLGPDALQNYQLLSVTPPWFGTLDASGSARLDIPTGLFPPGLQTDNIFFLQDPSTNQLLIYTHILEWDT